MALPSAEGCWDDQVVWGVRYPPQVPSHTTAGGKHGKAGEKQSVGHLLELSSRVCLSCLVMCLLQ